MNEVTKETAIVAINELMQAKEAVYNLVCTRRKNKFSFKRSSNAYKEINDLIKILRQENKL
ncbi:MAG: hypothetical protein LUF90_08000 [Rikenellaceae bacterium]|nr:hypothetical protein [Rikenellaceae bacterium]